MVFYEVKQETTTTDNTTNTDTQGVETESTTSEICTEIDNEDNVNKIVVDKFVIDLNKVFDSPTPCTDLTFEQKLYELYSKIVKSIGSAVLIGHYINNTADFYQFSASTQFTHLVIPSVLGYYFGKHISPIALSMYLMKKFF
jgi:hypothetical protein